MYQTLEDLCIRERERYAALPPPGECPCCGGLVLDKGSAAYRAWAETVDAIQAECIRLGVEGGGVPEEIAVISNRPYSIVALEIRHERERRGREAARRAREVTGVAL